MPLLSVNNLSVDFNTAEGLVAAVNNVSFTLNQNEILAIAGESGSGKSVTSLALMQLLPKTANVKGSLMFAANAQPAVDLLQQSKRYMQAIRGRQIAMIFQESMTSLNPVLTCGNQVLEAIQLHQKISATAARQQAIELFEKVQLPNPSAVGNKFPHQLSGGQKQRVMIAMAISCSPALLIADEPTTALDVTVQKTILELIKSLQVQNGMSVLLITHDLGLVADTADKLIVMYRGNIVEQGNAKEILRNPGHPYTRALMACRPALYTKGQRLPVAEEEQKPALTSGHIQVSENDFSMPKPTAESLSPCTATVLSVENLKVYYPGKKKLFEKAPPAFRALDDVSFTVQKGETVGLVGESGCGKTTLGRAILQLLPITAGKILLNGIDLAALNKNTLQPLRKDLQIVFQDPYGSLNPRLTIGNAIMEPMQVHAVGGNSQQRKDKVVELLEKVNLKATHFNRYPHEFSGGQRQRICIARALALNPSFLIFDESVSALDVSVQAQVLNLLNDLKKDFGFTSIFISHDLSVVRYISDRILVMQKGKIIESGPGEEVYMHPKEAYTRQLLDAIPGKILQV